MAKFGSAEVDFHQGVSLLLLLPQWNCVQNDYSLLFV